MFSLYDFFFPFIQPQEINFRDKSPFFRKSSKTPSAFSCACRLAECYFYAKHEPAALRSPLLYNPRYSERCTLRNTITLSFLLILSQVPTKIRLSLC